jgi:predicted permease
MLNRVRSWLQAAFRRGRLERDMQLEMQQHIDRAAERLVARGLSPDEAHLAARREFGNLGYMKEQGRDARGAVWLESVRADLRYAWRALRASPAFATVAVLSLAIGIGANTAIFSLINAVMLKTLPVERPGELVLLAMKDSATAQGLGQTEFTNPLWEQIRDRTDAYATYAVSGGTGFNLASGGEVRPVVAAWVNGDYFRTLGVRPALGRVFTTADDRRGCSPTVVVSYGFWQSELGGREDVVGKTISLSSQPFTIVGVAPPGFFGVDVGLTTAVYAPLCAEATARGESSSLDERSTWWLNILARPSAGVPIAQYNARLRAASRPVFEGAVPQRLDAKNHAEFIAQSLNSTPAGNGLSEVRTRYSNALFALMAMVAVILLISCANVANLLLARGAARSREMAIRIAIGASRVRLMRQFLTESVLLAVVGALVGVVLAAWGGRFLVGMLSDGGPTRIALDLTLDLRVMAFMAAVSIATVVLFGLAPAWRATRVDPQSAMKAGGRGRIEGHSRFRIGKALVVAQIALALILVVGAGLLVTTFRHLASVDPGFRSDGVLMVQVDLQRAAIPATQYAAVDRRLLERVRALPAVHAASISRMTPVSGSGWNDELVVDGFVPLNKRDDLAWFNSVGDGYFRTMGMRFIAGRDFGGEDNAGSTTVAIVNRAMVNRFFHGTSPLGRVYRTEDQGKRGPPVTIVGVVEDTKYVNLRETPDPIVYLSASQDSTPPSWVNLMMSVSGSPSAVIAGMKSIATSTDPRISLSFSTLSDQLARSLQRERVLAALSGVFGSLALLLAMIGLYGVMAYTVASRRVEIGIRIALGAVRSRVVRLVLGDVGRMVATVIVLGAVGAVAATQLLATFLYGVTARDPVTLVVAVFVLAAAAFVAGAIPAGRAARLEPVEALRED